MRLAFELLPFRIARFRLNRAGRDEAEWLRVRLDRESRPLGARVTRAPAPAAGGEEEFRLKVTAAAS
jgi:hypothetical protein